jgi:ApaG protein
MTKSATLKGHSDTTSDGIRVRVGAQFVPEQSDPDRQSFVFAYRVVIENVGQTPAQLLDRHWIIVDSLGEQREVRGPGVVGEQPTLGPGERFEYVSGAQLETEWGSMEGSYTFVRPDGAKFVARIGRFFLAPSLEPLGLESPRG